MDKAEFIDSIQFIKTLNATKIINGLLLRLSYFISKYFSTFIHWGKPEFISIEPTNLCNLKCPECPSGNNNLIRPRLFLSEKNYTNNIDQISNHLSYLQLFFQGEPFMHPKLFDFITYATSKKIYTSTSTNGQFLSADNCHKIINSGLQRILISIDGTSQETYQKYRVGGNLNTALNGLKTLSSLKAKTKSKTPYIVVQFVVLKHNEHQIPEIKQLADEYNADKLQIKSAQIEDFKNGSELFPKNNSYSRYKKLSNGTYSLKRPSHFKCKRIWFGSVISAENELLPCCFDKNGINPYNDNNIYSINETWRGSKATNFRKKVWSHNSKITMCKNCTEGLKVMQ